MSHHDASSHDPHFHGICWMLAVYGAFDIYVFSLGRIRGGWGSWADSIFLYLGLVLRDPCGLGNPFLPQKTSEDI